MKNENLVLTAILYRVPPISDEKRYGCELRDFSRTAHSFRKALRSSYGAIAEELGRYYGDPPDLRRSYGVVQE